MLDFRRVHSCLSGGKYMFSYIRNLKNMENNKYRTPEYEGGIKVKILYDSIDLCASLPCHCNSSDLFDGPLSTVHLISHSFQTERVFTYISNSFTSLPEYQLTSQKLARALLTYYIPSGYLSPHSQGKRSAPTPLAYVLLLVYPF
jgi:hypothetical protein